MLALGFAERRRSFAIVTALGARARQLGAFVRAEAVVVTVLGAVAGVVTGWVVALTLVKVLTGVFDPPPSALAIPWRYLATVGGLAIVAVVVAVEITIRLARHSTVERLRDL
jgi:putative ABC transport system permease protein